MPNGLRVNSSTAQGTSVVGSGKGTELQARGEQSSTVPTGKALPPALDAALGQLTEISTLPEVTTRIVELVEDPNATAQQMREVVCADPALASKILRVVNSAFYGLPSQVRSLDRAILLLGLSAVKNIALAASVARMFSVEHMAHHAVSRGIWRHSIATGVCCRMLAAAGRRDLSDEAFVVGLVHDLGLIVALQLFPARLKQVLETCQDQPQPFVPAETAVLGADHQMFGAALAQKWRFPPTLRHAMAYHHDMEVVGLRVQPATSLTYLADTLCGRGGFGLSITSALQEIPGDLLQVVELTTAQLDEVTASLRKGVEEAERLFAE